MSSYSSETRIFVPPVESPDKAADDRRSEARAITVYRPCCVRIGERSTAGLIRNMSAGGLMVETRLPARVGSEIEYLDGVSTWRRARVSWTGPNRLGLAHLEMEERQPVFPARPVRMPATLSARMWLDNGPVEIGIGNISQTGLFVFGVPRLHAGRLVTVSINRCDYPQSSVRWWADGSAGLRFHRPIPLSHLCDLVETKAA